MKNNKVSIITPSFNRGYIISETATSIFNQTYSNWEWVIVDDGSTDNSLELLKEYSNNDDRVKYYVRDRGPKGACTCRNIAVEKCTGDYVMFLDTDDVLAPFCIEQRVNAVEKNKDCDFLIFPMLMFREKLDDMNLLWNIDKDEDDLSRVLKGDPVCQGTGTLWKKSSFVDVGMWREDLKLWQDIELHIRAFLYPVKYKKCLGLKPDVYLRNTDDSLSRGDYHSLPKLNSRLNVFHYALNTIKEKGLVGKYRDGLRVMGTDIMLSLISGKLYLEAKKLSEDMGAAGVFDKGELSQFRLYARAHKLKLYKIPAAFNKIKDSVLELGANHEHTLNKIKYTSSLNS